MKKAVVYAVLSAQPQVWPRTTIRWRQWTLQYPWPRRWRSTLSVGRFAL